MENDINKMSLTELKAVGYDLVRQIERTTIALKEINEKIVTKERSEQTENAAGSPAR